MKKVIIISILIFTILISFLETSYAAITITEESLQESITRYKSMSDDESSTDDMFMQLDKTNKQIILKSEDQQYTVNYDLSSKPKFTIDLSFNSSMSQEDCEFESEKTALLMIMFVLIADSDGISFEDSMSYMFANMLEDGTATSYDDFTNAIAYAKSIYDNSSQNTITDELFTWTTAKISETSNEYKAQAILTINNDADFSIINGSTDNMMDNITDSFTSPEEDNFDQYQDIGTYEDENTQTSQTPPSTQSNPSNVNKTNTSTSELPKTGIFLNLKDSLIVLSIFTFVLSIIFVIKNKQYKDI